MLPQPPRYRYPVLPTLPIACDVVLGRRRRFGRDARRFLQALVPALDVGGQAPPIGVDGGLILVNHYSRPGFRAWWIALAISGTLEVDLHWVMTDAWTYPDRLRSSVVTPLSRWLFRRLARVYGFTSMPPMPPRPWEATARANAVRSVIRLARCRPCPAIALAPEGGDSSSGALVRPPPGAGRFAGYLVSAGLRPYAAGLYEQDGRLCLRFGAAVDLGEGRRDDRQLADRIMSAIAACLPERLRGAYA